MNLIEFLSPIVFWQVFKKVLVNLKNRSYYVKQMKTLDENGTLKQLGMRLDMRSRAYYILNLEPETLMMGQEVLDLEKSRVMESINVRKPAFMKANLFEMIEIETSRIKNEDYYAYLIQIKYRPSATIWNWVHIISWTASITILAYYILSQQSKIVEFVKDLLA
jgi:hypothetical protein